MNDIIRCNKKGCDKMAVAVADGLCFHHIRIALFGGED